MKYLTINSNRNNHSYSIALMKYGYFAIIKKDISGHYFFKQILGGGIEKTWTKYTKAEIEKNLFTHTMTGSLTWSPWFKSNRVFTHPEFVLWINPILTDFIVNLNNSIDWKQAGPIDMFMSPAEKIIFALEQLK